jgi:hypothetical protein
MWLALSALSFLPATLSDDAGHYWVSLHNIFSLVGLFAVE